MVSSLSFSRFSRSQSLAGNALSGGLLPPLAAEPLCLYSQVEPGNKEMFFSRSQSLAGNALSGGSASSSGIKQVVTATQPVRVETGLAFKLRSMGLVKFQGNDVTPLCDLYRLYFRERLGVN
ncbi:AAA-like domain-containing protein [Brasilonema sp. UFV-L1]|uniref:AAA-like domain-containing protein n=1 Tax=Brasilonema sp. UFV-L1 TaxID=2234130 RepID=UPI00403F8263